MSPARRFGRPLRLLLIVCLGWSLPYLTAQETPATSGDVITMEAFNITTYSGKIPVIDGFTGKDYDGSNQVVVEFANSFNKLLLAYHRRLVTNEVKHLNFRYALGGQFEAEMTQLGASLGFRPFALEKSSWLTRERAIVSRLVNRPFFKINALVVWDVERLQDIAPAKPKNKYARDIRLNPETQRWERRVMARWNVSFPRGNNRSFFTEKDQGLNLDTLRGFHFIENGLPGDVPPQAFQDVKLTYPIFYAESVEDEATLRRLQQTFIANLHFIYDPFSWVARRDLRFRGGFLNECRDYLAQQRLPITDRDWFDPVLATLLSDLVTIKLQGVDEIYDYRMLSRYVRESPRSLGLGLDLLNWNSNENRTATDDPPKPVRLGAGSGEGFRFILIDAYQQFGDKLLDDIRARLAAARESRSKIGGQDMLHAVVAELAGEPFGKFSAAALRRQEIRLEEHRIDEATLMKLAR